MESPQTNFKKRRVALYARVSTSDQKNGLDAQIRALIIFCEQNKITEYEIFADENQSGTKASRPSLDRMMKAVENGEIDTVVVFAFSRYARSVSHMLKGLEIFRKCQTNFVSLTEKLDLNTSLGHVVFVIISAIAQLERDLIAERVQNGLAAQKPEEKESVVSAKKIPHLLNHFLMQPSPIAKSPESQNVLMARSMRRRKNLWLDVENKNVKSSSSSINRWRPIQLLMQSLK